MVLLSGSSREMSPCNGCTEKFDYCHGRRPKDARGEKGFAAYRAEIERINEQRRQYKAKPYVKPYE